MFTLFAEFVFFVSASAVFILFVSISVESQAAQADSLCYRSHCTIYTHNTLYGNS